MAPPCAMLNQEKAMSQVFIAMKWACHLFILRDSHDACHYNYNFHNRKVQGVMTNLEIDHVTPSFCLCAAC